MIHKQIFIAFFRAGMLGYGGGLSAIPLMHREVVNIYKWMDDDEFSDVLALANTLPGPINTKLSGYIGYRIAGFKGMMTALIATVIPTAFLMIILLTTLNAYKDKSWVQGMAKGVLPVAGVMIGVLAWSFIKVAYRSMGRIRTAVLTILSLIVMELLGIHPALLIVVFIGIAILAPTKSEQKKKNRVEDH